MMKEPEKNFAINLKLRLELEVWRIILETTPQLSNSGSEE
jgi:hypothetical protein